MNVSVLLWSWWLLKRKKKKSESAGENVLGIVVEWWEQWRGSLWCVVGSKLWDPCGIGQVGREGLVRIEGVVGLASDAEWLDLDPPNCCGLGERAGMRCCPRTCLDLV